jgi:hypothetical protein
MALPYSGQPTSPQVVENYTLAFNRNLLPMERYIFNESAREYDQVALVESTDRITNEMQIAQGLGRPKQARDLEPVPQTVPVIGYKSVIRILNYKVGMTVEETLMRTAVFKQPLDNARDMMRSTVSLKDVTTVDFFNNGFTDGLQQNITEYDNTLRAFFSTAHLYENGSGPWSNYYNVGVPPNPDTVYLVINQYLKRLSDYTGANFVDYGPTFVIVTPTLNPAYGMAADEIIQSMDRPDTANRATNVLKSINLKHVALNRLTSSTKWFIMVLPGSTPSFPLKMLEMIPYQVSPLAAVGPINPDAYVCRARTQFGVGYSISYRGVVAVGA